MDIDQIQICQFLKSWPGQFVSRKEICRRAGGKWRYREDEYWAVPALQRLIEDHLVESDDTGHFRLKKQTATVVENRKRLWLSPTIKRIFEQSGRDFGVIDLDKEVDPADLQMSSEPLLCHPLDEQKE
jgi:hypothetical protein